MARAKKEKAQQTAKMQIPVRDRGSSVPVHPGVEHDPMLQLRMGSEEPVRLPDSISDPSCAVVLRSEYTLSSDAAGSLAWSVGHGLTNDKNVYAITAGVLGASPTTTSHPQLSAFAAEARVARQVAVKVVVKYIGQQQLESGYLSYFEKTTTSDMDGQSIDNLHIGAQAQVRPGEGLIAFMDYTQTPRWENQSAGNFMLYTYPFAGFVASGLEPSKPTFRVKVVRFLEYLPIEGSLSEADAQYEPHNPGSLAAWEALNRPGASLTTESKWSKFTAEVKDLANAAYHMAQPLIPYAVPAAKAVLKSSGFGAFLL